MKQLQKLLWLTQLGVSLVTPPLLCLLLGHLAQSKWGWGTWVMVAAILSGLPPRHAAQPRSSVTAKETVKEKERAISPLPLTTTNRACRKRG